MPCTWIKYRGKDILYSDFAGMIKNQETFPMFETIDKLYPQKGPKVRHLLNFTGTIASRDFMEKAKELGKKYEELGYKDAYFGVEGLQSVLLKSYLLFIGGTTRGRVFDDVEKAKEWLAEGE